MRNRRLIRLPLALVLLSGLVAKSWAGGEARTEIVWHKSYAKARQEAKATGKPLLVEFR